MTLEALQSSIQQEVAAFAETIARKTILLYTDNLMKNLSAGLSQTHSAPARSKPPEPESVRRKRGRPAKLRKDLCKEGDGRAVVAKGLCSTHYQKARAKLRATTPQPALADSPPASPAVAENGTPEATAAQ